MVSPGRVRAQPAAPVQQPHPEQGKEGSRGGVGGGKGRGSAEAQTVACLTPALAVHESRRGTPQLPTACSAWPGQGCIRTLTAWTVVTRSRAACSRSECGVTAGVTVCGRQTRQSEDVRRAAWSRAGSEEEAGPAPERAGCAGLVPLGLAGGPGTRERAVAVGRWRSRQRAHAEHAGPLEDLGDRGPESARGCRLGLPVSKPGWLLRAGRPWARLRATVLTCEWETSRLPPRWLPGAAVIL